MNIEMLKRIETASAINARYGRPEIGSRVGMSGEGLGTLEYHTEDGWSGVREGIDIHEHKTNTLHKMSAVVGK